MSDVIGIFVNFNTVSTRSFFDVLMKIVLMERPNNSNEISGKLSPPTVHTASVILKTTFTKVNKEEYRKSSKTKVEKEYGLTDGGVIVLERQESEEKWGTSPPAKNGADPSRREDNEWTTHGTTCGRKLAIVSDETTTISITCFSDEASTMTKYCTQVLAEIRNKNPYQLPSSLKVLEEKDNSTIEAPKKTTRKALFERKTTVNDESAGIKKMKHVG
ncbi:hypothetical protein Tco_1086673 [Tanacetum coccineum]